MPKRTALPEISRQVGHHCRPRSRPLHNHSRPWMFFGHKSCFWKLKDTRSAVTTNYAICRPYIWVKLHHSLGTCFRNPCVTISFVLNDLWPRKNDPAFESNPCETTNRNSFTYVTVLCGTEKYVWIAHRHLSGSTRYREGPLQDAPGPTASSNGKFSSSLNRMEILSGQRYDPFPGQLRGIAHRGLDGLTGDRRVACCDFL